MGSESCEADATNPLDKGKAEAREHRAGHLQQAAGSGQPSTLGRSSLAFSQPHSPSASEEARRERVASRRPGFLGLECVCARAHFRLGQVGLPSGRERDSESQLYDSGERPTGSGLRSLTSGRYIR